MEKVDLGEKGGGGSFNGWSGWVIWGDRLGMEALDS